MASKITIKRSTTAVPPAGLSFGEMAFVQGTGLTANQLYVGISGGSPVWVGAQIGTTGSWTDNAARTSLATQYAIDQRISAQISGGSPITTVSDNTNTTRYLVFGSTAGAGVTLFVDDSTTPLAYNPSTADLTLKGDLNIAGDIVAGAGKQTGNVFATTTTKINIGLAATGITMGGTGGTIALRNPTLVLGTTGSTITTTSGITNSLNISPFGNLTLAPTATIGLIGLSTPSIAISNSGGGQVAIAGGDLALGIKQTGEFSYEPVNIVFEGLTDNEFETTLTVVDPTADRTISLPNASDTLVGKATTDTFTNKTYDTGNTGNVFRIAGVTLSGVTGTGSVVLSTSPAITTSLIAGSTTFALLNTTATTVNFAGAATALNIGASGGTATFGGNVIVTGDLAVNGADITTSSTGTATVFNTNATTLNMGGGAGTISIGSGGGTISINSDDTVVTGDLAVNSGFIVTNQGIVNIFNGTATTVNAFGAATAVNIGAAGGTATFAGALTVSGNLTVNGTTTTLNSTTLTVDDKNIEMGVVADPTVDTADGGGIILKGDSDKSILWDKLNTNFTSNQHWNLPTGKLFKINNATVLSSSALGSGVTGSSLTQVGTITSGTWSGSFGAVSGASLTNLIATNVVATEQTTGTMFLVGVAAGGTTGLLVNATPATALAYNVATGELSATLIDGGSF
jgi:hypothetical protein